MALAQACEANTCAGAWSSLDTHLFTAVMPWSVHPCATAPTVNNFTPLRGECAPIMLVLHTIRSLTLYSRLLAAELARLTPKTHCSAATVKGSERGEARLTDPEWRTMGT